MSFFLVRFNKTSKPLLFRIMIYVGIAMIFLGLIKRQKRAKEVKELIEERRQKRIMEDDDSNLRQGTQPQQPTNTKKQGMATRASAQEYQHGSTHTQQHHYGQGMQNQRAHHHQQQQTHPQHQRPVNNQQQTQANQQQAHQQHHTQQPKQPVNQQPMQGHKKFCHSCGSQVHPAGKFCSQCGTHV